MSAETSIEIWLQENEMFVRGVEKMLGTPLSDELVALTQQLIEIEGWQSTVGAWNVALNSLPYSRLGRLTKDRVFNLVTSIRSRLIFGQCLMRTLSDEKYR